MGGFSKYGGGGSRGGDRGGDRGGRSFGGGGFGGGSRGGERSFGARSEGPKTMFPAVCSTCGQNCEIPFKPTGIHPVFCRNCFKNQAPTAGASRPGQRTFSSPSARPAFSPRPFGSTPPNTGAITRDQFEALNAKLDKILTFVSAAKSAKYEEVEKDWIIGSKSKPALAEVEEMAPAKKSKAPAKKAAAKGKKK